ncbi:hypothetical protein KKB18_07460 [bacterium]|nr:hypothetical protein [bacterium]
MKDINHIHRQAMDFAEQAFSAKREGDIELSKELFLQAMELEIKAANALKDDFDREPSRSVLYRSAASLALECGQLVYAYDLICEAFRGNPPHEIAEELIKLKELLLAKLLKQFQELEIKVHELELQLTG